MLSVYNPSVCLLKAMLHHIIKWLHVQNVTPAASDCRWGTAVELNWWFQRLLVVICRYSCSTALASLHPAIGSGLMAACGCVCVFVFMCACVCSLGCTARSLRIYFLGNTLCLTVPELLFCSEVSVRRIPGCTKLHANPLFF